MSTKTVSTMIVSAILIAALALYLRREPQPDATEAAKPTSREAKAVQGEQPALPERVAAPNAAPSASQNPPDAPLDHANAPAPITEALEELKLPGVPEIQETERKFAAEAIDPTWSREAEANILAEIAQMTGLKLVTLRAECKTTLCRLQVSQQEVSGKTPFPQLANHLGLKPLWILGAVTRNGVPTSVAYFERESSAK